MKQPQEKGPQAPLFALVPLSKLHESTLNPRRRFDEKALAELTESVRTHGVLTPLLARPNSSGYEIAAGHRRFRAATAAGLAELPVMIREMSDQQFVEVVTIENLQREDVHPVEEAEGYQRLIDSYGYTPAMLSERVGRSESYVAKRLALTKLVEQAKTAFLDGRIQLGHAVLLARLQPDDQRQAFKEALFDRDEQWRDGKWVKVAPAAVPVSALDAWIHENVYLDLSSAAWRKDDAALLAGAGPCTSCPKRTGANGLLFDDVKKGDLCLDADCFHQKRDNHLIHIQKAAEDAGTPLVEIARGYVSDAQKQGVLSTSSYHLVSGKKDRCEYVEKAVVAVGTREVGKVVDICRTKACKQHGEYIYGSGIAGGEQKTFAQIWSDRKKKLDEKIGLEVKRELWRQVVYEVPEEFSRFEMELVGRKLIDRSGHDGRQALCGALVLDGEKGKYSTDYAAPLISHMQNLADKDLPGFLVGLALYGALAYRDDDLVALAKEYEIDVKAVEKAVGDPLRADFEKRKAKAAASRDKKQKQAKKAAKTAKTKPAHGGTKPPKRGTNPAATEATRVWPKPNEYGVYEEQNCIKVDCREKGFTARILLVETEKGWIGSFEAILPSGDHGSLPGEHDVAFPSQLEALCRTCETILAWISARRTMVGLAGSKKALEQFGKLEKWVTKIQADARDVQANERVAAGERDPADPDYNAGEGEE
jgi:ParB family chromosome partitioning protein